MKIHFKVPFFTRFGQNVVVSGDIPELGNNNFRRAFPLNFQGHEDWVGEIEINPTKDQIIVYKYLVFDETNGTHIEEWGERKIEISQTNVDKIYCFDQWNAAGKIENVLMSSPFQKVLLKNNEEKKQPREEKNFTHELIVKAPLIKENQVVCVVGNCQELGEWSVNNPAIMHLSDDKWILKKDLRKVKKDILFKFGIFDLSIKQFVEFEEGPDRFLPLFGSKSLVKFDGGFIRMNDTTWKGAGVGLPISSIRTRKSFGTGDFVDLKLLVDWAAKVGLKLIQVLPLNDTNGTQTENDVLPYAAISAFALNPLYLNIPAMGKLSDTHEIQKQYIPKQAELNAMPLLPFLEVVNFKIEYAKQLYLQEKEIFLNDKDFQLYFDQNEYWLKPYAAYCFLRDKFKTNNYREWEEFALYDAGKIEELTSSNQPHFDQIGAIYFIQYHLHKQLKKSTEYAHSKGVILKGDIPIGVNRNSIDTWVNPNLFHMDMNAGAPPDMFAIKGQNWELPTYNWEEMKQTGFKWWKQRFGQMSNYFDTFRIDHILGFFRIWQIPTNQIEGIMGHLNPSIPIYINEFSEKGIWFDYNRFCKPYITEDILWRFFEEEVEWVKSNCLQIEDGWILRLKDQFKSQTYVEKLFDKGEISERIKWGLFDLISNVLFFEVPNSNQTQFFPRYGMHSLPTYQELDDHTKRGLDELYIHYYYHRQDENWYHSGMEKLPALKKTTNMMICGEDLGMMTQCVTDVMSELGILSLEVQRAPKSNKIEFSHPNNAPYLSVVTPSTHDMSTIRGWWEEDKSVTQRFYNTQLGHWGEAPYFCEWWINRDIVLQHLYSPAMWAIFQMQDLLGISEKVRRENPHDERINVPSSSKTSWRYRLHINLEDLLEEDDFNNELKNYIVQSKR